MAVIMHIDANSAYLSWTATYLLEQGYPIDIRDIPSAISGNPENRHGIILAKSIPAKKYKITTGESLFQARQKCPRLKVYPPDYDLYLKCSDAMHTILSEYSPSIQRYSVDECFLDYTFSEHKYGDPLKVAYQIKDRIKEELGFTVNIGISSNKLLAKMGSELEKPDRVHTLFPNEISEKLWTLPVGELFMVGRATKDKLNKVNIRTIGDLAKEDPIYLKALLKSHGLLVWNYANGIDDSTVTLNSDIGQKGLGNSTTIAYDITTAREAYKVILALTERVGMRLRRMRRFANVISIGVKTDSFVRYSHQVKLPIAVNCTGEIYECACRLLDECWKGEPIRHIGVSLSELDAFEDPQISIFEKGDLERLKALEKTLDSIRCKYGERSIIMGTFANGDVDPVQGGTNDGDFIMMGGYQQ